MPEWMKCKERLPAEVQDVLLCREKGIFMGYRRGNHWWYREGDELDLIQVKWDSEFGELEYFTHWMPLPAPPSDPTPGFERNPNPAAPPWERQEFPKVTAPRRMND